MKAVKITKIVWDQSQKRDDLPKYKGFKAEDDFNVPEKVPSLLEKKYGCPIVEFAFVEIHIAKDLNELFEMNKPAYMKTTQFFKKGNKLNSKGEYVFELIKNRIRYKFELEEKGVSEVDMPKIVDEVILGIENVFGINVEGKNVNQIINIISSKLEYSDSDEE